jgi:deoxyribonuclease V
MDVRIISEEARVGIAILSYPGMVPLDAVVFEAPLIFPYIPGLLAFRTGSAILVACEKLKLKPDLLMVHGHGTAHPRGFGLASHIGLWLDLPTIGIAKSRLYGNHVAVGYQPGKWSVLQDQLEPSRIIGVALRTCEKTRPIYISPGHLIDLQHSVSFTLACCRGFRLPEPIRAAHKAITGTN